MAGLMGGLVYAFSPADLTIIELKMTGSETIVIENTSSGQLNLDDYLVQYFNKAAPSSFAVSTSSQLLPDMTLLPGQTILISGDNSPTCGATAVANQSFSMSDSAGYLAVTKINSQSDGSLVFVPQDHVSWTSAASGADIVKVPSNTADPDAVWYRKFSSGAWQQADQTGDCGTIVSLSSPATGPTFVQWADGSEPPAVIISTGQSGSGGASIPTSDIGLAPPRVTEALPNPASPGTDAEDEFIELYNPNDAAFDLSGFKLIVGSTSSRSYTIPDGTTMAPKSFKAFFSIDTNLALSNSSGQVRLADPLGTVINQTDPYGSAKEGQSWALANGAWYWTSTPTPNANNLINGSALVKSAKATSSKTPTSVKGASTSSLGFDSSGASTNSAPVNQIHPWTIAGVGSMALLYAAYEYRLDLANRYDKFRKYLEARRIAGK